jgi:dihydropyrimidinase
MLMSEGVRAGQITLSRFVELTSTNAAKIFGLYPRKGTIAVGSHADVVVWDLTERRVVDGANMNSRAGYSVYDGWAVTGWPVLVISRGNVVFEGTTVTAKRGRGQWVQRERTTPL